MEETLFDTPALLTSFRNSRAKLSMWRMAIWRPIEAVDTRDPTKRTNHWLENGPPFWMLWKPGKDGDFLWRFVSLKEASAWFKSLGASDRWLRFYQWCRCLRITVGLYWLGCSAVGSVNASLNEVMNKLKDWSKRSTCPSGNDHISHLGKTKIIDSKVSW